ncbi:MAG TPA: hypothetical protein DCM40_20830, partial [Maribacter sp.]|nr:hypothetical protein [Maribacter sp.]
FKLYQSNGTLKGQHDVGVIAQDVQKVLPEAVQERRNGKEDGALAVDYKKLIPLLVEGIKEQQKEIDMLKEKINKLEKE